MRRVDNRLVFASGFAIVAAGCLLNAQLTSSWSGDNFFISQIVLGCGLPLAFTALVGSIVQNSFDSGALASPMNILTYSAFIHSVRLLGGEAGSAMMQRLVSVREKFHSNMIGLHLDGGNWLVSERVASLAHGIFPSSAGTQEAQQRAVVVLGGQVRLQAFALAYSDCYMAIALVAALAIILIALLKPMKIYFDES
jgi:DHA2 family multidrug resistance protein